MDRRLQTSRKNYGPRREQWPNCVPNARIPRNAGSKTLLDPFVDPRCALILKQRQTSPSYGVQRQQSTWMSSTTVAVVLLVYLALHPLSSFSALRRFIDIRPLT